MQLDIKKTQHWADIQADFRDSKLGFLLKFSRILMKML